MNSSHFERVSDVEAYYAERGKPHSLQMIPAIKSDCALGFQGRETWLRTVDVAVLRCFRPSSSSCCSPSKLQHALVAIGRTLTFPFASISVSPLT
jgi:hypothetical protein